MKSIEGRMNGGADPASPEARRRHDAFSSHFATRGGSEKRLLARHNADFWVWKYELDPAYKNASHAPVPPRWK